MRSLCALLSFISLSSLSGAELGQPTLRAWEDYIRKADSKAMTRSLAASRFLMIDELSEAGRRLQRGETFVAPFQKSGIVAIPAGLIHDWLGAAFIPNVSLKDVLSVVRNYGQYEKLYRPAVLESRCISRDESRDLFSMIWSKKTFFTAVTLEGDYESSYTQIAQTRWISDSHSTRIREIEDHGKPSERRLEPGKGSGYIWRLNSFARYEQKDGGVYVEIEAIALSRDIPPTIRWFVCPIVARTSRDALATSLQQTRKAAAALTNQNSKDQTGTNDSLNRGATHS
jgi:hypothetical protein